MIGYTPKCDYQYVAINQRLRALHAEIVTDVVHDIENLCGRRIPMVPESCLLELNNNLFISVVISRCFTTPVGTRVQCVEKMKAPRQINAMLMNDKNKFTSSYAKALLDATSANQLVNKGRPKKETPAILARQARLEEESLAPSREIGSIEGAVRYRDDRHDIHI